MKSMTEQRYFKGDKRNKQFGYAVPYGARVEAVRFGPRRKVLVQWNGQLFITMLWCLCKIPINRVSTGEYQEQRSEC